jgi:hypothetical protein
MAHTQQPGPWDVVKVERIPVPPLPPGYRLQDKAPPPLPPGYRLDDSSGSRAHAPTGDIFDQLAAEAKHKKTSGDIFDQLVAEANAKKASTRPTDDGWNVVSKAPIRQPMGHIDTHGVTLSAAPPQSAFQRFKSMLANGAVGHALESTMPRVADTLDLHPSTTYGPDYALRNGQRQTPMVTRTRQSRRPSVRVTRWFRDEAKRAAQALGYNVIERRSRFGAMKWNSHG